MNNLNAILSVDNKTALLILMIVLIVFVVLLTVLGIVFIIALRKRRPVVKVLMAPTPQEGKSEQQSTDAVKPAEAAPASVTEDAPVQLQIEEVKEEAPVVQAAVEPQVKEVEPEIAAVAVDEVNEPASDRYSAIKDDLLTQEKVKEHMSAQRTDNSTKSNKKFRIAIAKRK